LSTTFQDVFQLFDLEGLIGLVTFGQLLELHEWWRGFSTVTSHSPWLNGITLSLDVNIPEKANLLISPGNDLIQFFVIHVASLLVLFLVGLEGRTLCKTVKLKI
jgi:hypothetical protein